MDIVIYRDVGGFPVWFGLRSCFFCVTCCFRRDLHVALWWFSGYDENCHLQVWRCWISGGMTTTHQDWVTLNEGIEGVEGRARHGCGVQMSGVIDASFLQGVRSSAIQEELRIRLLLLHIESSHLRWFRYLRMMPLWCLLGEMFQACRTRKDDTLERFCLLAGLGTPRVMDG